MSDIAEVECLGCGRIAETCKECVCGRFIFGQGEDVARALEKTNPWLKKLMIDALEKMLDGEVEDNDDKEDNDGYRL